MPRQKIIKNPESPGGRKDWEGRTPRRRVSLTHEELRVIAESMERLFLVDPDSEEKDTYQGVYAKILQHIEEIEKPLVEEVDTHPLLDMVK